MDWLDPDQNIKLTENIKIGRLCKPSYFTVKFWNHYQGNACWLNRSIYTYCKRTQHYTTEFVPPVYYRREGLFCSGY